VSAPQVDHDLLADYVGGALDGTPAHDTVARLVATDPAWRHAAEQLTAALQATALDLGRLRDTPEPMPADVVERISAALAPLAREVVPPPRPKPFIHKLRWAVPIAVAAAALGFYALKVPLQSSTQTAGTPMLKGPPEIASDSAGAATPQPVPTVTSGRQLDRNTIRDYAARSATVPSKSQGLSGNDLTPGLQRLSDPHALKACLDAVAVVLPGMPTLVDYANFEGRPALVISITATDGKWTFVAGPNCGLTGPDEIYRAPLQ
jgi:hypothetical protein